MAKKSFQNSDFSEQYKSPKWQKFRLQILEIFGFKCGSCGSTENQLHVHHNHYEKNKPIWDYSALEVTVLCDECHKERHKLINDFLEFTGCCTNKEIAELILICRKIKFFDYVNAPIDE